MPQDINNPFKNALSNRIYQRINNLLYSKTDDSDVSRFSAPEQLVFPCASIAVAFTRGVYKPTLPESEDFVNLLAFGLLHFLLLYSAQVYIQERSIATNGKPYILKTAGEKTPEAAKKAILIMKKATPPKAAYDVIYKNYKLMEQTHFKKDFSLNGYKFVKKDFLAFADVCAILGYFFAKEVLTDLPEN